MDGSEGEGVSRADVAEWFGFSLFQGGEWEVR